MYTQCTECEQQQALTIKELRSSQGMIRCNQCSSIFNALNHLTDHARTSKPDQNVTPSTEIIPTKQIVNWNLWISLCFILLVFQLYFFEGYQLTQNTTLRPWLVKTCQTINCKLPIYKNLNDITILQGSFQPITEHHSIFRTSFINQSDFEQNYPAIKLTLQNFTGDDFAERIFYPTDYIIGKSDKITPYMSTEITLDIATPPRKVGGYRFELI